MRCTVFGTGYLGATHAAGMAELGHDVVGVDIDPGKVAKLSAGEVPFYEPGLRKMLSDNIAAGRLRFTTDYDVAAEFADVHFLGVGTPQKKGEYGADLRHVHSVIDDTGAAADAARGDRRQVDRPGGNGGRTGRARQGARARRASTSRWRGTRSSCGRASPSRTPCTPTASCLACNGIRCAPRPRSGSCTHRCSTTGVPFLLTDLQTAELVKVSANAFLATKISFINAISEVCEAADADVTVLADALGYDPRIGRRFLNAGLGFGGGCLPKDIRAFMARAGELGANHALTFLREVDSINMRRRTRMVELTTHGLRRVAAGRQHRRAGRGVQARVRRRARLAGAQRRGDAAAQRRDGQRLRPKALENSRRVFPTLNYSTSVAEACDRADAVLVLTEWQEFVDLDPGDLADVVRARVVVDGRNCLDTRRWLAADWQVHCLGRRLEKGLA